MRAHFAWAALFTCADAAAHGSKASAQLVRDATASVAVAFFGETGPVQGAEKAAGAAEDEAEKLGEDAIDGPDKMVDAAGGMVGQDHLMETNMPESKEAKGEANKVMEDANLANEVEEHFVASLYHKMTDGKQAAACDANVMLSWDANGGFCSVHAWVLVASSCGYGALAFTVWMMVCKGKGRSKTPWTANQLAQTPFKATGICTCCKLKPLAIAETIFCNFFMWSETMTRSGTMPTAVIYIVGFIVWVLSPFVHSATFIYCMFRFFGRYKLREKMESKEEQHQHEEEETSNALNDLACAGCCGICAVAQEAEYLELKANEGQPAPDGADLRHLLEWQVEHHEEHKQEHW